MTAPSELPPLRPEALEGHVLALCEIGNRFVGTPGEARAREHLLAEFRAAGLANVRSEELVLLAYRPGGAAACELVGGGAELPAVELQFTASGEAEGEAVYLGFPQRIADLEELLRGGVSLEGKIAVLHSYWPFVFGEWIAAQGAVGLVNVADTPEGLIGHFTARLYPPPERSEFADWPLPIPGVTIEAIAARKLLALMTSGPRRLRVRHDCSYEAVETANVIGEIPGRDAPDERVVLGAHYDTQLEGVGACDNATGLATVLEVARTWADLPLRRTLVLCAFANEEHGFWGSVDYVRRHAAELERTVGMVNLDALAWIYPCKRSLHADPSMREFALESGRRIGWVPEDELEASLLQASDHNPFIDAGVPAAWFWRYPPQHPHYHSAGDTPELLDYELVADTARVSAYTVLRLAREDVDLGRSRPSKRWIDLRPR